MRDAGSNDVAAVPIASELAEVLDNWRGMTDNRSSSDPVLPWPYDAYRQLYENWHHIQETAGIPEERASSRRTADPRVPQN